MPHFEVKSVPPRKKKEWSGFFLSICFEKKCPGHGTHTHTHHLSGARGGAHTPYGGVQEIFLFFFGQGTVFCSTHIHFKKNYVKRKVKKVGGKAKTRNNFLTHWREMPPESDSDSE